MAIIRKYGKQFDDSLEDDDGNQIYDALGIELWCIAKGKEWIEAGGRTLEFHYENVRKIIWGELDVHRWHTLTTKEIVNHKVCVLMGAGCVKGSTRILNPITGEQPTIQELCENQIAPMVMTLNGPRLASVPFIKGVEDLYEVVLENGSKFTGTLKHRVLTPSGYSHVSDVKIGDYLFGYAPCLPGSISEPDQSVRALGVHDSQKKAGGFPVDCSAYLNPDDAQLLLAREADQSSSPSPDDAPEHKAYSFCGWDDPGSALENIRPYQSDGLPSMRNAFHSGYKPENVLSPRCALATQEPSRDVYQFSDLSQKGCNRPSPSEGPSRDETRSEIFCNSSYRQQKDSSFALMVSQSRVVSITRTHKQVFYDLTVPKQEHYFAEGMIHHNSTGKTHAAAWIALVTYWARPEHTCVLVASTHLGGLKKRVWAEVTMLWEQGVERFPKLAGHLLDSAIAITTDNVEDCDPGERKIRDMRKGIFGVACVTGGKFVGLSKFVGIKQKWMILVADEASMMGETFLSAFANLNKNENFQAIVMGNPNDPLDPLGRAAEPKEGWTDDYMEPKKTMVWDTRFMNGRCVNLIGLDSPNFDYPPEEKTRFKYLISKEKIDDTLSFFPKDSMEYYSQCVGSMKIGTIARRVLSRSMVKEFHAQDEAVWSDHNQTFVYFVDSSYGGDRCVAGWGAFGLDVQGKQILSFSIPKIIPILIGKGVEPEDQIARFVKQDCETESIPPENMGHDATGRGSLGTSLAREWSAMTNPIDAGGRPTSRPVSMEITILDPDTGVKRPKRCDEHYDRLVSEFWFSVRYAVESGQVRGLCDEAVEELCARKWDRIRGDKYSVEVKDGTPTKPGMKQRTGKSPDIGDWVAGIVEMARRKGFIISKLGNPSKVKSDADDWFAQESKKLDKLRKSRQLTSF